MIPYFGGKYLLTPKIIGLMPPHRRYIEPFFGGGHVFFRKVPADESIINDINEELVTFYTVVRDKPDELNKLISSMPLHEAQYKRFEQTTGGTDVERAYRFIYRLYGSYNKQLSYFSMSPSTQSAWLNLPRLVEVINKKLRNTAILCRSFDEVIHEYASADSLMYLDPPYFVTTKSSSKYYDYILTKEQHILLHDLCLTTPAKVIISYDNDEYVRQLYSERKFRIFEVDVRYPGVNRNKILYEVQSQCKTELIITNYDIQLSLPLFT